MKLSTIGPIIGRTCEILFFHVPMLMIPVAMVLTGVLAIQEIARDREMAEPIWNQAIQEQNGTTWRTPISPEETARILNDKQAKVSFQQGAVGGGMFSGTDREPALMVEMADGSRYFCAVEMGAAKIHGQQADFASTKCFKLGA